MGKEAEGQLEGDNALDLSPDVTVNAKKLGTFMATVTILKGMVGAGILSLPHAFSQVGLSVAVPCMLLIGAVCGFACWRLAECVELMRSAPPSLCGKVESMDSDDSSEPEPPQDYGLGSMARVASGAFGFAGVATVALAINVGQLGCCLAFIVIMVETLKKDTLLGKVMPELWLRVILCGMLCVLVLMRQLLQLAWLSTAALLTYAYTFIALLRWGTDQFITGKAPDLTETWPARGASRLGAFFGTAVFAQSGIVMTQYVYEGMDLPTPRPFKVALGASFGFASCLYAFVGAFAFMAYGDEIERIFPHNFPASSVDTVIAEVILCIVLFLTFVLQIFPVLTFAEATLLGINIFNEEEGEKGEKAEDSDSDSGSLADQDVTRRKTMDTALSVLLRWSVVIGLCVLASLIPKVTCVTEISGSVAYSNLSFTIPGLCHLKLRGWDIKPTELVTDAFLIIFGLATMVVGLAAVDC